MNTMDRKATFAFCNGFADAYNRARANKDSNPCGFEISIAQRYAEAFSKGAYFFGPFAVAPKQVKSSWWNVTDLRGGWGYNPLNFEIQVEGEEPTKEEVIKGFRQKATYFREQANLLDAAVEMLGA